MRISSELRVRAIMRRAQSAGAPCYLLSRGDPERGAIYLSVRVEGGRAVLFGPPPPSLDRVAEENGLVPVLSSEPIPEAEVEAFVRRQRTIDPDLWLIEIEDDAGRNFSLE